MKGPISSHRSMRAVIRRHIDWRAIKLAIPEALADWQVIMVWVTYLHWAVFFLNFHFLPKIRSFNGKLQARPLA